MTTGLGVVPGDELGNLAIEASALDRARVFACTFVKRVAIKSGPKFST